LSTSKAFMLAIALMIILVGCGPRLRSVETREADQPLESEPSQCTHTIKGKVTDKSNGREIPNARGVVVTVTGTFKFEGSTFELRFPAMSVADLRVEAPGYKPFSRQLKAHYERNAALKIEIRLEPAGPVEVTPQSL